MEDGRNLANWMMNRKGSMGTFVVSRVLVRSLIPLLLPAIFASLVVSCFWFLVPALRL